MRYRTGLFMAVLTVVSLLGGCRAASLGKDQGTRAIFSAQASRATAEPAPLTAEDALGITRNHGAPMVLEDESGKGGKGGLEAVVLGKQDE